MLFFRLMKILENSWRVKHNIDPVWADEGADYFREISIDLDDMSRSLQLPIMLTMSGQFRKQQELLFMKALLAPAQTAGLRI